MNVDAQIARVRRKIHEAQEIGWSARAKGLHFAIDSHRLRYEPPMSEREVSRFETRVGITLPEGYRAFITRIAASGGGPFYGLMSLEQASREFGSFDTRHLALPCPIRPGVEYSADWMAELGIDFDDDDDEPYPGLLALALQGCGGSCALVVSGEARGRIINLWGDMTPPHFVHDATFLDWYERWLDDLIADIPTSQFGYTRGGTLDELVASYAEARCREEKLQILSSYRRHSTLTEAAMSLALTVTTSDDPGLRAAAVHALARHGTAGRRAAVEALRDPDPDVRCAAVTALRFSGGVRHELDSLRTQLDDESVSEVVGCIAGALLHTGDLRVEDLRGSLNSPDARARSTAEYYRKVLESPQQTNAPSLLRRLFKKKR